MAEKSGIAGRAGNAPVRGFGQRALLRGELMHPRRRVDDSDSRQAGARLGRGGRDSGPEGNEILTSAAAVVLVGLLVAEGITIVHMRGLLSAHMFIGLVLIGPVLLKLGSTGYRMVSYYAGSRVYRAKGPPLLPLRLMAPVLVASTVAVLASGVLLLAAGHKSGPLLTIHKVSFIVFGVLLAVHLGARTLSASCAPYASTGARHVAGPFPARASERCLSQLRSAVARRSRWLFCRRFTLITAAASSALVSAPSHTRAPSIPFPASPHRSAY